MLHETETEETMVFFVTFLSLVAFQLGGVRALCPPLWLRLWGLMARAEISLECFEGSGWLSG